MFTALFKKFYSGNTFGSGIAFAGARQSNAGSVPPFPANSADNGLSVDAITGHIVLGDSQFDVLEPGKFLNNRKLVLDNHIFNISNDTTGGTDFVRIDPVSGQIVFVAADFLGSNAQIQMLGVTPTTAEIALQTILGVSPTDQQKIDLDSGAGRATIARVSSGLVFVNKLLIDFANSVYQFGDIDTELHGSKLNIDDVNETVVLQARDFPSIGNAELLLISQPGTELASMFTRNSINQFTTAAIDGVNGIWRAHANSNNTYLRMSDFNQVIDAGTDPPGNKYLLLDIANQLFQLGDIDGATNNNFVEVNNLTSAFTFKRGTNRFIRADIPNGVYQLGDIDAISDGSRIEINDFPGGSFIFLRAGAGTNITTLYIDDATGEFRLSNNPNTASVRINGTLGFTGTVSPVTSITVNGGIVTNVT